MAIIGPLNAYIPARLWYLKLASLERQVCRVELFHQGFRQYSTGFLVGPDLILTSYHSLEHVIEAKINERVVDPQQNIGFRFDFIEDLDFAPRPGVVFQLSRNWLVDHFAVNRSTDISGLDYVLIRVDGEPGLQILENGMTRGWIKVITDSFDISVGGALAILQHPIGRPLQISIDTHSILGIDQEKSTIFYRTNTEPGSSGSPCFDLNWRLIAMHQGGDLHDRNRGILVQSMVDIWREREILPLVTKQLPSDLPNISNYQNITIPKGAFALDPGLRELIARGESEELEIKSGLRRAKKEGNENQVGLNITKSVCGFMNHKDGGVVVIGISNDGEIIGVNNEYSIIDKSKASWDGFELYLRQVLDSRIDIENPHLYYKITRLIEEDKDICVIYVKAANKAVWLDEKFYLRVGNLTKELKGRNLMDYIKRRWEG